MNNRYLNSPTILNNAEAYKQIFKEKNIPYIVNYTTFNFSNLINIDDYGINFILHDVSFNEKLYQISQKYYGSPDYAWLICFLNKLSNETLIDVNTTLKIYYPLNKVLGVLNGRL